MLHLRHCVRYLCLFALFLEVLLPVSGKEKPQLHSLPLAFEQNQGQAPSAARFLVHRDGVSALFGRDGVAFQLPGRGGSRQSVELHWIAPEVAPEGRDLQPGHSNYLLGRDRAKWIRNIPLYSAIEYQQLYPGISLLFYGNGDSLEHDFRLSAGADPGKIALRFKGADQVEVDSRGDLQVQVASGRLTLRRPVAYQEIEGHKSVEANFALEEDGTVRFRIGSYDRGHPLVIDPVFTFSTYLAGTGIDQISAVTTDATGNIYATGWTSSTDFPTAKPLEQACTDEACRSIFVTKLDPTGHTLLYSTYIGSAGVYGAGGGIAVTSTGTAVITGISMGNSFPQAGSLPSIAQCPNGGACYYLVSLKPDGSGFNYSGMLQAEQSQFATDGVVALDAAGNAYLSGGTWLSSFPLTPGTLATSVPGYPYTSSFVLKVDATGKLLYSTIIPGNAPDNSAIAYNNIFNAYGIVADSSGQVTISGTAGLGLPTTAGVIQGTYPNSTNNTSPQAGFLLQLNATASAINFASYLPGTDSAAGMAIDTAGNYYFAGTTGETTLPVSSNAYQKARSPISCDCSSGYIMQVNPHATAVLAATYLNAPPPASQGAGSSLTGIAVDSHNNIFVEGTTSAAQFPLKNPFVTQIESGAFDVDLVLAELSPDLSSLLFGSFLNPTDGVYAGSVAAAIAVDATDKLIVGGLTYAADFPTTANSVQPNLPAPASFLSSPQHSFITKIDMSIPAPSVCLDNMNVGLGNVPAKTSSSQAVKVTNCGNAPLTVASVLSTDPSVVASDDCTDIAPASACTVTLNFTPPNTSAVSGSISIADNAAISPQMLAFAGQGTGPEIVTQPTALSFGHLLVGTASPGLQVFLSNGGTAAVRISKISVSGAGYSIAGNNCPSTLTPQQQFCGVQVGFSPAAAGAQSGSLVISSNDPVNPTLTVALMGTGDAAYGVPAISSIGSGTVKINNGPVSITVLGANFYPASVVQLNGVTQQSTFVSNSQISVTLAAASLTTLGEETLSVTNPGNPTAATAVVTPYAALPVNPAALVSVPATKLLYAAMPASSTTDPNTVLPIDPATLKTGTPIPVGNDPAYLAASSDGSYLYIANRGDETVQRINLQSGSVDRTFPYSPNPFCTGCSILPASDLEAVPGSPTEVVLAQNGMLSLYNDSGLVNFSPAAFVEIAAPTFSNFTFAGTPPTIYSLPFATVPNPFFEIATLDSTGVHWSPVTGPNTLVPPGIGNQVVSDGTLLYTSDGEVWDPSTKKLVVTFPVSNFNGFGSVAVNTATHRFLALGFQNYDSQGDSAVANILTAYSTQSYKLLGTLAFPQSTTPIPTGLTPWGTDGIAFLADNAVYLTRSSLMGTEAENPVPVITSISPASTPAESAQPNLMITGTGFVPDSTVLWNGNNVPVQYYTSTSIQAILTNANVASPGTVTVQVVNPAPGGGSSAVVNYTVGPAIPIASFLQTILDFGTVEEGQTSPSQEVFLTNTGAGVLHISAVAASGDYAVTSTCGTSLGAHGLCRLFVTFAPTASGTRTGMLSVSDDSGNAPQTVNLTGIGSLTGPAGPQLSIGQASGSSTSATVTAGGTATYSLTLSSTGGFTGAVTLACSGAPANSTCSVAPATLNLTADGSSAFKVTVATNVSQSSSVRASPRIMMSGLAGLSLFIMPFVSRRRRRALAALVLFLVVSTGLILGCGGGGSGTPPSGGSAVTPSGTYTLSVKATSGTLTATQPLTLTVQ